MLDIADEIVLVTDTILIIDPAPQLRQRANSLISGRRWSTPSILYGDQQEPAIDEYGDDSLLEDGSPPDGQPRWSFSFALGLDHISNGHGDWFADVAAILDYLHTIAVEYSCESVVEIRYTSKPWQCEHVAYIDEEPRDHPKIRQMMLRILHLSE